ncbi:two-component system, OmpR family, sensor histidine kinase ResE [Thermanaeromonas toyohensis ToBE]|uniref:histidine kinase n=1 Tax=Thermanaeromonas toyohensis ToBE TaxID=698762 RepID=A0A1W1VMH6_9FIRM|nr:ATP-binding protein [Thermanaeromonas toyohensis]SMB94251.1 two-component system, OmpR family, sensor histidine kinase ResE [Thermanaeromonas toyohensis ToBE]
MFWRGITGKLWLTLVSVVLVSLLIVGVFLDRLLESFYFRQRGLELLKKGELIAEALADGARRGYLLEQVDILGDVAGAGVTIIDRKGLIISCGGMNMGGPDHGRSMHMGWPTIGMHLGTEEARRVLLGQTVITRGYHPGFNATMLTVGVPIKVGEEVVGAVLLYSPQASLGEAVSVMRRLILLAAVGAIIVATVLAFFVSRKVSRPLLAMNRVARQMAAGDFSGQIEVTSQDEVGTLAQSLNYLSGQLKITIAALSREKEKLNRVVSGMTDGVLAFDARGYILFSNPQAEKLLGLPLPVGEKIPEELWEKSRVLEGQDISEREIEWRGKIIAVRASLMKTGGGEDGSTVALFQDVTEKRKLEQLRREFLASVSHELRTPLSFIQGYAEAILDGLAQDEKEQREYISIIWEEAGRLRRLVEDLLDLSKLAAGQLNLDREEIEVKDLLRRVARKFQGIFAERGIKFEFEVKEEGKGLPHVYGDAGRLEQILVNLLDNAARYTPAGGKVSLKARQEGEEIVFIVQDTGQGIPAEELPYIWERFYRVDKSRSRKDGGSGLGLAIVRHLVEAHGGRVNVVSTPGQGSTFQVYLPIYHPQAKALCRI